MKSLYGTAPLSGAMRQGQVDKLVGIVGIGNEGAEEETQAEREREDRKAIAKE